MRPESSTDDPQGVWVSVVDRQNVLEIPVDAVTSLVCHVLDAEGVLGGVEIAFVDDDAIAELHEEFLGVKGPTDVITFPLDPEDDPSQPETDEAASLGEIVVSTETARRQAPEYLGDAVSEALLYVVHGVLHLLRYDDRDPEDRARMDERQLALLTSWQKNRS